MSAALQVAWRGAANTREWRKIAHLGIELQATQRRHPPFVIPIPDLWSGSLSSTSMPLSSATLGRSQLLFSKSSKLRPPISSRPISDDSQLRHASRLLSTSLQCQVRYASSSSQSPPSALKNPIKSLKQLTPHENIYTIPNILTSTRLIAAPAVGYFVLTSQPIAALALFAYAGVTDLVDGYLARRLNQFTVVGSVIDPMADKLLMAICVLSLGYVGTFPWWLVTIIFGRDFALAISAIWWRYISLPPPKTFMRYWDFSLPSAEVHPTEISKINTLLQLLLVGNVMVLPVLPEALVTALNLWGVQAGWEYLVAGTTLWSGLSYIGNKDAVKVLSQQEVKQKMDAMEAEEDAEGQAVERARRRKGESEGNRRKQ